MTHERYREKKKEASVHKLRAIKYRGLGDQWRAVVEFQLAARRELEASAEAVDEVATVGAQVEACGLLFEALDPLSASKEWKRLTAVEGTEIPEALQTRAREEGERFSRTWEAFKATLPDESFRNVRLEPIQRVLAQYPGIAGFWWAKYRFHERRQEWREAAAALDRALELAPENRRFMAMRMLLSADLNKPESARRRARETWERHGETSAEINQVYALVLLKLTRKGGRAEALPELDDATRRAEALATGTYLQRQATLLRAYVATLLGEEPREELQPAMENGRVDERKVIRLCVPDPDHQELASLAA